MQPVLQAILLALVGLAVVRGQAPSSPPTTLPPSAQSAFQKGLRAAEKQDWARALDLLEQARQQAPQAPQVLFQLARAESQIGGRELRAMAWFEAYLGVNPQAPDRDQVGKEMAALETKVHSNIAELIAAARSSLSAGPRRYGQRISWQACGIAPQRCPVETNRGYASRNGRLRRSAPDGVRLGRLDTARVDHGGSREGPT